MTYQAFLTRLTSTIFFQSITIACVTSMFFQTGIFVFALIRYTSFQVATTSGFIAGELFFFLSFISAFFSLKLNKNL